MTFSLNCYADRVPEPLQVDLTGVVGQFELPRFEIAARLEPCLSGQESQPISTASLPQ
jgi:hypothetical protein